MSDRRRYALATCRIGARGEPEFLLTTTRDGRLTLPKGGRGEGEGKKAAAKREAREEAGITNPSLTGDRVQYQHMTATGTIQQVTAYLSVSATLTRPDRTERWRQHVWLSAGQAAADPRVGAPLAAALDTLEQALARQATVSYIHAA